MKKMICILLAAVMVLCVCGCQEAVKPTDETTTGPSLETTEPVLQDSIFDNDNVHATNPVDDTTAPQDATDPSQSTESTENTQGSQGTEGTENTEGTEPTEATEPAESTQPSETPDDGVVDYEDFIAMTPAQQRAFQESFGQGEAGLDAFFAWYNAAKEAYEKEHPPIHIGGNGVIDMDKLTGGNG